MDGLVASEPSCPRFELRLRSFFTEKIYDVAVIINKLQSLDQVDLPYTGNWHASAAKRRNVCDSTVKGIDPNIRQTKSIIVEIDRSFCKNIEVPSLQMTIWKT